MNNMKNDKAVKICFKAKVANVVSRYLIHEAERSTKVSIVPLIHEPQYPLELLKDSMK